MVFFMQECSSGGETFAPGHVLSKAVHTPQAGDNMGSGTGGACETISLQHLS